MAPKLNVSIFFVLSLFILRAQATIVGQWALDNFSMNCPSDGHSCDYEFQVVEGVDTYNSTTTTCKFSIYSQGMPAHLVNYTAQQCDGSDVYKINGGWDPLGFITLCVSHASEDVWAFFGYENRQVVNTNATWMNIRPAYKMFTFNKTDEAVLRGTRGVPTLGHGKAVTRLHDRVSRPRSHRRVDDPTDSNHLEYWTVENLHHRITSDLTTPTYTVKISFDVVVRNSSSAGNLSWYGGTCALLEKVGNSRNASVASFHNQPCFQTEDGFYFSWYPWATMDVAWLMITNPTKALRLFIAIGNSDFEHRSSGPWRAEYLGPA